MTSIPGWFQWRSGQEEAVHRFDEGSRFVEVGSFLGRSLCSLGEVVQGGGTFAGQLHKNIIDCGYADAISLLVADSVTASTFFADRSLTWVHLDAGHRYEDVKADIAARI